MSDITHASGICPSLSSLTSLRLCLLDYICTANHTTCRVPLRLPRTPWATTVYIVLYDSVLLNQSMPPSPLNTVCRLSDILPPANAHRPLAVDIRYFGAVAGLPRTRPTYEQLLRVVNLAPHAGRAQRCRITDGPPAVHYRATRPRAGAGRQSGSTGQHSTSLPDDPHPVRTSAHHHLPWPHRHVAAQVQSRATCTPIIARRIITYLACTATSPSPPPSCDHCDMPPSPVGHRSPC